MAYHLSSATVDYIAPSQACIKPIRSKVSPLESAVPVKAVVQAPVPSSFATSSIMQSIADAGAAETTAEAIKVSLADCLACSGCVTSAETVLVNQQSISEFVDTARSFNPSAPAFAHLPPLPPKDPSRTTSTRRRQLVVTLAPVSIASVAAAIFTPALDTATPPPPRDQPAAYAAAFALVAALFEDMGAVLVSDASYAEAVAHCEGAAEAISHATRSGSDRRAFTPLLSSQCPGTVCYVEKKAPTLVPLLSRVASPQAIAGAVVHAAYRGGLIGAAAPAAADDAPTCGVWHVAVYSCFDKKLEAARERAAQPDADGDTSGDGVGLVLTTVEVVGLLRQFAQHSAAVRAVAHAILTGDDVAPSAAWAAPAAEPFAARVRASRYAPQLGGRYAVSGAPGQVAAAAMAAAVLHGASGATSGDVSAARGAAAAALAAPLGYAPIRAKRDDYARAALAADGVAPAPTVSAVYGLQHVQNIVRLLEGGSRAQRGGATASALPVDAAVDTAAAGAADAASAGNAQMRVVEPASGVDAHVIDFLACPSGCPNGAGNVPATDAIDVSALVAPPVQSDEPVLATGTGAGATATLSANRTRVAAVVGVQSALQGAPTGTDACDGPTPQVTLEDVIAYVVASRAPPPALSWVYELVDASGVGDAAAARAFHAEYHAVHETLPTQEIGKAPAAMVTREALAW